MEEKEQEYGQRWEEFVSTCIHNTYECIYYFGWFAVKKIQRLDTIRCWFLVVILICVFSMNLSLYKLDWYLCPNSTQVIYCYHISTTRW